MNDTPDTSTFYDHSEFMAAMRAPEYATSARYRDETAAKLARSQAAGTVGHMSKSYGGSDRGPNATASYHSTAHHYVAPVRDLDGDDSGAFGGLKSMPAPNQAAIEGTKLSYGVFEDIDTAVLASHAPAFKADPSYRQALIAKLRRSVTAGKLPRDILDQTAGW